MRKQILDVDWESVEHNTDIVANLFSKRMFFNSKSITRKDVEHELIVTFT